MHQQKRHLTSRTSCHRPHSTTRAAHERLRCPESRPRCLWPQRSSAVVAQSEEPISALPPGTRGILQESNDFKESKVSKARPLRFRRRGATRVPWSAGFCSAQKSKESIKNQTSNSKSKTHSKQIQTFDFESGPCKMNYKIKQGP